jgi:2-oxo-3-hexenedioate decarboxylase
MTDLAKLAERLDNAQRDAKATPQLSLEQDLSIGDAYKIQEMLIHRRIARNEKRIGMKMGFTSRAKMVQMGLSDMIWGRLTDRMMLEDGGNLTFSSYVHPRVEPEVAFLLKKPISGPITPAQAMAAVEAVAPAIEVIDSRYENFKFSLADVIADNSSSSGIVLGAWRRPDTDLSNLGMVLELNGRVVQVGSTAALLGHPARSLAAASRLVAEAGETLESGWIIMAGGATAAEALGQGVCARLTIQELGSVSITAV